MVVRGAFLSLIFVLGAAAVATGTIPGDAGAISACYVRNTGVLRVIEAEAAPRCRASEESLSWNEKGPQFAATLLDLAGTAAHVHDAPMLATPRLSADPTPSVEGVLS